MNCSILVRGPFAMLFICLLSANGWVAAVIEKLWLEIAALRAEVQQLRREVAAIKSQQK